MQPSFVVSLLPAITWRRLFARPLGHALCLARPLGSVECHLLLPLRRMGSHRVWMDSPLPERHRESCRFLLPDTLPEEASVPRIGIDAFLDAMGIAVQTPKDNLLDKHRAVASSARVLTFDVRSPKEFESGHIPGATNVPLLSNAERHEVGKTFADRGKETAIDVAMSRVLPGLGRFPETAAAKASEIDDGGKRRVLVYCWRGGMRSASVAWLLRVHGFDAVVLHGGYKAFRTRVVSVLSPQPPPQNPREFDLTPQFQRKPVDASALDRVSAPNRGPKLLQLGQQLNEAKQFSDALAAFEEAARTLEAEGLTHGRLLWNVHSYAGDCLLQLGEDEAALAAYALADACVAGEPRVLRGQTVALYRLRRLSEALAAARAALVSSPKWRIGHCIVEKLGELSEEPPASPGEEDGDEAECDSWDLTFRPAGRDTHAEKQADGAAGAWPTPPIVVLSGPTGSGKTDILHELHRLGEQFVDLEGLAHHRASAFGAVGLPPQPSNEMYTNLIFICWRSLDGSRPVWLEHEDNHIGTCSVPTGILSFLESAPGGMILISMDRELRVERLVKDYCGEAVDPERSQQLIDSIISLEKRWGKKRVAQAVEQIQAGDFASVARDALLYYDGLYDKHSEETAAVAQAVVRLSLSSPDAAENARAALEAYQRDLAAVPGAAA